MNGLSPDNKESLEELPLMGHLLELRDRLLKAIILVLLCFVVIFPFQDPILLYLSYPLRLHLDVNASMIHTGVVAPLMVPFKMALVFSFIVGLPFIVRQAWAFIAPGLYKKEKTIVLPLIVSSILLFYAGIAFSFYVVFPLAFEFLSTMGPKEIPMMTDSSAYLTFVFQMFFAFGLMFEIPIATFILIWIGVTTPASLAKKRAYVVIGCFVLGMLLTPPDMISQTLLALPMWLLFEVGIIFGRFVKPRTEDKNAEADVA